MFYIVRFVINELGYNCLWFSDKNGKDKFLTNGNRVIYFIKCSDLHCYISEKKLDTEQEQICYDINVAIDWLAKRNHIIDYDYFLSLWNITSDIAHSTNKYFIGDSLDETTTNIYNKLFSCNNLPALKEYKKVLTSKWNDEEINHFQLIIIDSINIIKAVFHE